MERIESYRDLIVWQRAMMLAERVYTLTHRFPEDERYGLTSQARRAAVSIAANIAEGDMDAAPGRPMRAFSGSRGGSLRELETHLLLSQRLAMIDAATIDAVLVDADEIGRMRHALIARLREPQRTS